MTSYVYSPLIKRTSSRVNRTKDRFQLTALRRNVAENETIDFTGVHRITEVQYVHIYSHYTFCPFLLE